MKKLVLAIFLISFVQTFAQNHAPVFLKEMPDTTIDFDKIFKFTYKAIDEDGDKISYSSVNDLPPRATFNDSTGVFSWKPLSSQAGKYEIIINATDGKATTQSRKTKLIMVPTFIYHNEIKLSSSPSDGGIPFVSSIYCNDEDTITVKAKANNGYKFMSWKEKDSVVSKDSVYTFVSYGNRNLVANFRINRAPVFVKEMNDTTFYQDLLIGSYQAIDPDGDSVKYYATQLFPKWAALQPKLGTFGWRPLQLEAAMNFIQIYATDGQLKTYSRISTLNYSTNGTYFSKTLRMNVKPNNAGYAYRIINNDTINLRAVPYNGYKFLNWTYNEVIVTQDSFYTIIEKNIEGQISLVANFSELTSIQNKNEMPFRYHLSQNYPNPFNPETTIEYSIPVAEAKFASTTRHVTLKVYDLLGREVATLVDEYKQPGFYNYKLSMINYKLSSGVYFYRLKAGSYSETKKLLFLK